MPRRLGCDRVEGRTGAGTYLVTDDGQGDAMARWQLDPTTGLLTLANSFTYATWVAPTTATHDRHSGPTTCRPVLRGDWRP